jgi:hypothetical protein
MKSKNLKDLINFRVSHKQWLLFDHLCKNATNRPDINTKRVLLLSQEDFRSSVPKGFDFMGQSTNRYTEGSSKTKISKLDLSILINQEILRLQISMDNSLAVTMVKSIEDLIKIWLSYIRRKRGTSYLNHVRSQVVLILIQVSFQILVQEFKDKIQLLLGRIVNNILKTNR